MPRRRRSLFRAEPPNKPTLPADTTRRWWALRLKARLCLAPLVFAWLLGPASAGEAEWRIEAESKECTRTGDTSINAYEWASGGKAVWLRNAGDSISLSLGKDVPEGYYRVRVRGRTTGPLVSGYVLRIGEEREPFRRQGDADKVGHPVGEVGWVEAVVFLKSKAELVISNTRVWALVDVVELSPTVLQEKVIEAESGLCARTGEASVSKAEWASGGAVAWLNKTDAKLTYKVGSVSPGVYDLRLSVRTLSGLRPGYILTVNGYGAPLSPVGEDRKVGSPVGQVGRLRCRLHLQPGDVIGIRHLRAYAMVDCIRLVPVRDPIVPVSEDEEPGQPKSAELSLRSPALNPVKFLEPEDALPVWLVRDGKPAASIVAAPVLDDREASKLVSLGVPFTVLAAVEELQTCIKRATGAELPIYIDRMPDSGNVVLVGASRFTKGLGIDPEALPPSGFVVKTLPGKVVIAGRDRCAGPDFCRESGTLWGLYDFLERVLGVRYYYPGELGTIIPRRRDLAVPALHIQDSPHFRKRYIWRFHGQLKNMPPRLAGDSRAGAHFRNEDISGIPTASHTFGGWRKLYGKTHEEFFEMARDGSRKSSQLCFSEPAVLSQFLQNLEEERGRIIPVSPIDMSLKCQCPRCLAKVDPRSFLSEYSQVMGEFVYRLAMEAKKRWPERTVAYLPYQNYVAPPKGIEFPDNVVVTICGMRTLANYKEPEIYQDEREILDGWKKILKRPIGHWHYLCWPADCTAAPYQFRHVMKRFFTDYRDSMGTFADVGLDWSRKHLTIYLFCRLLWNPDFDVDAAFDEYCRLMYGRAYGPMKAVFELLTDRWEQSRWSHPLPPYHRISLRNVQVETFPPEAVKKLRELYAGALDRLAEDSMEAQRIRFFGIALEAFFRESNRFHQSHERRTLRVAKANAAPKVDGQLSEACWQKGEKAGFLEGYNAKAPKPKIGTSVQGVRTEAGVTFAFTLEEPDLANLRANKTGRDEQVFLDDCIEIFLDPKGEFGDYYQIVVNAKGAIFDASSLSDPYASWNCKGAKVGVAQGEKGWTLEVYLPFADLGIKGAEAGGSWYGNFTRSRWHGGFQLQRFSTVDVPPQKTSNLNMRHFGKIEFVE